MPVNSPTGQQYSRCFISAPFGMDLGELPILLGERHIAWNWSADTQAEVRFAPIIQKCDFAIAVLDGSQSDQRVLYEVGLAEGLGKPVLKIAASKRVGTLARSLFTFVDVKLGERDALAFHLDAFLSTPHETVFESDRTTNSTKPIAPPSPRFPPQQFHSELEARVYDAVIEAGGSAIVEPRTDDISGRPDLLIWLSSEDAELLDPAVIEIKSGLASADARRAEQQLLEFMQAAGVRSGFLLTQQEPPEKRRLVSPYVFWLSVDHFVALTRDHRLGEYLRNLRNRLAHGAP
ncbi:MAG: hypothetical protein EOQ40_15120 [Mesorhizobium sp.]|uniref:hypothetical protein n=1 Tax=Mesorhizobium sp. TaxID=1871066 RepID=UPI000FE75051|nr:hypothetical protein [Mesorhizobium sp.]RWB20396.1 MAG: hypothetical protein EOQ40_15120 [Mesorhizobium sp.]